MSHTDKLSAMEAAKDAIWNVCCSQYGVTYEAMAQAAITAYLKAVQEDEAVVERVARAIFPLAEIDMYPTAMDMASAALSALLEEPKG